MTAINKPQRCQLLNNVISTTFGERYKDLLIETENLASHLYASWLGERLDYMRKLPKDWWQWGGTVRILSGKNTKEDAVAMVRPFMVTRYLEGSRKWESRYEVPETYDCVPVSDLLPVCKTGYAGAFHMTAPFATFAEHNTKVKVLQAEAAELLGEIKPFVLGVKSLEALRKAWPEVEPFLPEALKNPEKAGLPMLRVSKVNALIAKAKEASPVAQKIIAAKKGGKK